MRIAILKSAICLLLLSCSVLQPSQAAPVNVIFDTDVWSDIDDVLALAMLHTLQDRRELNLLAVTISTDEKWCATYVDLVNTFYGYPNTPIGIVHSGVKPDDFPEKFPNSKWPITLYTQVISQRKAPDGSLLYPRRLTDGTTATEAVSLLRKTLAGQPDGGVVLIQVGYSTNLARLLDSNADAASALNGRELIKKKVSWLSMMGGSFAEIRAAGRMIPKGKPEFNLIADLHAAQKLFAEWPTPIVASGLEIGFALYYPGHSIEHDYSYADGHPIADTYRTYCEEQQRNHVMSKPCPHDHPTWDLTSVLYAARPDRNYFSLSKPGTITVLADGGTRFDQSASGRHRYLILDDAHRARALEALVMLSSQPPFHARQPKR